MKDIELLAVVQLMDDFTGRPIVSEAAHFYFRENAKVDFRADEQYFSLQKASKWRWVPCRPVAKPNGFYVFTLLPEKAPHLRITCRGFVDYQVQLTSPLKLPLSDAIVLCRLAPAPDYPYPVGTTLVRGRVVTYRAEEDDDDSPGGREQEPRPLGAVAVSGSYGGAPSPEPATYSGSKPREMYHGRYALALPGALPTGSQVRLTMNFKKTGFDSVKQGFEIVAGRTNFLDDVVMS